MIGGREKTIRILLRDERGPGLLEPLFHFFFERRDHVFLFVEVIGFHAGLRRFLRHGMKDQFEFAPRGRYGSLDSLEDVRRRELIHRDGKGRGGFTQEGFQFAPAGLGADTDRHLHLFFDRREIRRNRLLIGPGFGRQKGEWFISAEHFLERRDHRSVRHSKGDRLSLVGSQLLLHGGVNHRERKSEFFL